MCVFIRWKHVYYVHDLCKTFIIVYDLRAYDERVLMWNYPLGGSGRTETDEGVAGEVRSTCE